MIAELIISSDFTIEDIHNIREYHYELTKDMTTQEKINFYNEGRKEKASFSYVMANFEATLPEQTITNAERKR